MIGVYFSITIILIFLLLGFFILMKGQNNKQNLVFFLFILSSAFWTFSNLMVDISSHRQVALLWSKITLIGPIILPIFLFYFTLIFPEDVFKRKKIIFITPLVFIAVILLIFVPSNINIKDVYLIPGEVPKVETGMLYIYFSIYFILSMLLSIGNLIRKYFIYSGYKKLQIRYIFVGIIITFILGIFTNLILLQVGVSKYASFGPYFNIIFISFTVYSIVRYRLMDIRLVVTKSILYFVLALFVALSFTFVTFSTAQFFQGEGQLMVTIVVSFIVAIFLDPLKKLLAKLTDRFFYKGKIDYQDVLREIGQEIARELDLERLLNALKQSLETRIKLKNVNILITKGNGKEGEVRKYETLGVDQPVSLSEDSRIISFVKKMNELVITEELSRKKADTGIESEKQTFDELQKELDSLNVSLVIPISTEKNLIGLILVESKLSGGAFTQEDINFFELLAPQTATALEKSKLFEEVQSAKANLEVLVEKRTADLKERNHYLIALQNLIGIITRSLDFEKVMQTIADGIHKELGFIGGLLSFIDFNNNTIKIKAISQTPLTGPALKLVPNDPTKYSVSLDRDDDNISVQAIKDQKMVSSDSFYDSVTPALNKAVAFAIQKLAGIKSVICVPVYSEEKVIGVIDFILAKKAEDVTDIEKEMMKSLANQVGIVYRNLTLYNEIQKANYDLKQANIRLKKLDETKSEFLSIASHQLRTPLTGIKGYLSMVLEGDFGQVQPRIKGVVQEVYQNTDRLTRLVNIFLNVSRIESGRFEITRKDADIIKLIEGVIKTLQLNADQKKLKLSFHKPKEALPVIKIDQEKIQDVLLNLVDNAIKYTPKGKIDVFIEKTGQALKITIQDTGVGMKKGEDKELFKKFVRGEGIAQINTGGSGLGLFIAKKIVEAHQGKIWAESEGKDMGSKFIFTLPLEG